MMIRDGEKYRRPTAEEQGMNDEVFAPGRWPRGQRNPEQRERARKQAKRERIMGAIAVVLFLTFFLGTCFAMALACLALFNWVTS